MSLGSHHPHPVFSKMFHFQTGDVANDIGNNVGRRIADLIKQLFFQYCRGYASSLAGVNCNDQSSILADFSDWESESVEVGDLLPAAVVVAARCLPAAF